MPVDRRRFLQASAVAGAAAVASSNLKEASPQSSSDAKKPALPLFVATWPFGKTSCERAVAVAASGSMLDAIEQGIWVTESDVSNASVGIGGIPNADGQVELDACIMSGPGHRAGSVGGIQDILHPISVARKVMETTPHVMLVGQGATDFALANGFSKTQLLTDQQSRRWENWKQEQHQKPPQINEENHDTIAMIGLDQKGDLYGGCSTSGWGFKIPGRVGDSPIIGGGLYVDNTVGAAGATGLGENVMRYCGSFLVVEFMRGGASPVEACKLTVQRIAQLDPKGIKELSINFIALNKNGEHGAAGTNEGFKYSFADKDSSGVIAAHAMSHQKIGPDGGNLR